VRIDRPEKVSMEREAFILASGESFSAWEVGFACLERDEPKQGEVFQAYHG